MQVPLEAVTDRVTQLQDKIDGLGEKFYNFIHLLEKDAPPLPHEEFKFANRAPARAATAAKSGGEAPLLPVLPSITAEPVPTGPTIEVMEGEAANMAQLVLNNVKGSLHAPLFCLFFAQFLSVAKMSRGGHSDRLAPGNQLHKA